MTSATRQTAFVTGASSGIGWELARLFAKDGYDLVLVARNQARLEALAQELRAAHGVQVTVLPADLSEPEAAAGVVARLEQLGIMVDVLVNDAGTQVYAPFAEAGAQKLVDMIQINVTALMQLTHLLLPGMIQRGRGRILNLGSTGSFTPGPLNAVYCATKAFVLSLSEAIAAELDGTGVTVTALCPGAVRTDFVERHGLQDVRWWKNAVLPAPVAKTGYRALMRGKRVVVAGGGNKLRVLSFKLMLLFDTAIPNRMIMQLGGYFMGRMRTGARA
jgi:short-subunit dehydrogenase